MNSSSEQANIFIPHSRGVNSYLRLLEEALAKNGVEVVFGRFPTSSDQRQVSWIHWPEQLTNYSPPSESDLKRIEESLKLATEHGILLWTVHNAWRHGMREHKGFNALYAMVASYADAHLHHGNESVRIIEELYPGTRKVRRVFNHGGYWNLLGSESKESARLALGISDDVKVMLAFGNIRSSSELILSMDICNVKDWTLLIAGRPPYIRKRHRISYYYRTLRFKRRIRVCEGLFEDAQIDRIVKACDAVLIPRFECLNSGNVFLGFTFEKPVIGPDIGNVGEILQQTGNEVFDPEVKGDIIRAVRRLQSRDMEELGEKNASWLSANCRWEQAAEATIDAIREVQAMKCSRQALSNSDETIDL